MLDAADLAIDSKDIATSYDNSKKTLPVNSVVDVNIVDAHFADIHPDNQAVEGAECIAVVMQMKLPEIVNGFKITKKFKLRHTDGEKRKKAKDEFLVLDKILGGHILAAMKQGQPVTDNLLKQHFMLGATRRQGHRSQHSSLLKSNCRLRSGSIFLLWSTSFNKIKIGLTRNPKP